MTFICITLTVRETLFAEPPIEVSNICIHYSKLSVYNSGELDILSGMSIQLPDRIDLTQNIISEFMQ